ncbi:MAG TPA: hypothetical protein VKU19_11780 [Bryobacteraceae bacterium]|nr:hypothetical protein [Bryobacteraceae bacterium]
MPAASIRVLPSLCRFESAVAGRESLSSTTIARLANSLSRSLMSEMLTATAAGV